MKVTCSRSTGERNALQLLLEPDQHDAVHGREQRAREQRAALAARCRARACAAAPRCRRTGGQVRLVPGRDLAPLGEAMIEQRAPAPRVRGRVVRVGEREMGQPSGSRRPAGPRLVRPRRVSVFSSCSSVQRIHGEDQVVEVGEDVVDRADRAADLVGELARLQAAQALRVDRALGGVDQRIPQFAPPGDRFRLGNH